MQRDLNLVVVVVVCLSSKYKVKLGWTWTWNHALLNRRTTSQSLLEQRQRDRERQEEREHNIVTDESESWRVWAAVVKASPRNPLLACEVVVCVLWNDEVDWARLPALTSFFELTATAVTKTKSRHCTSKQTKIITTEDDRLEVKKKKNDNYFAESIFCDGLSHTWVVSRSGRELPPILDY